METSTINLKTEALKNGAIWGAINLVIFLITWYIMPSIMSSFWFTGLSIVIGILLAVFFTLDLRKKTGGYWSFGEALWPIFAMFLTSMAIVFLFTVVFGKFIDPTYPVKMKELSLASSEKMMTSLGVSDEALETAMTEASNNLDKQFSPTFSQAVLSFGIAAIFYFIGALIFALIFKKTNPNPWAASEEENVSTQ